MLSPYQSYLKRLREYNARREKIMKVTLPNGLVLEGTSDQVSNTAKLLGFTLGSDGVHYHSSTRGLIRIADMDDNHLRNAMLKLYREWASNLSSLTGRDLVTAVRNGPSDTTFRGLVVEYTSRVANGRIR